jgi:hypothetical protein
VSLAGRTWGEYLFIDFGVDIPMSSISYMHINVYNGSWNSDGTWSTNVGRTPRTEYTGSINGITMYQLLWLDANNQTLQWNFFDTDPIQIAGECAARKMYYLYPGKGDWYPATTDTYPNTVAPRVTRPPGKREQALHEARCTTTAQAPAELKCIDSATGAGGARIRIELVLPLCSRMDCTPCRHAERHNMWVCGRVQSGRVQSGRVQSGRVQSGRVQSGRVQSANSRDSVPRTARLL